ncbi:MAG: ester cyclase [Planctomycetota bacterium]
MRALRQTLGWTQCDAAARSGYSERLIGKLENGGPVAPRSLQETLQAYNENLADAQRVSPADFIIDETHSGNGDDVKRLTREWFDRVFNQRDLSAIGQFMHPDVVLVAEGETRKGREMIMERAATLLAAFDPLQLRIERLISQGNTAIAYWVVEKKNVSEFLGIPATYKWVKLRGNSLAVYHQGLIVEARDHWDVQDLVQQLTGEPSRPV